MSGHLAKKQTRLDKTGLTLPLAGCVEEDLQLQVTGLATTVDPVALTLGAACPAHE